MVTTLVPGGLEVPPFAGALLDEQARAAQAAHRPSLSPRKPNGFTMRSEYREATGSGRHCCNGRAPRPEPKLAFDARELRFELAERFAVALPRGKLDALLEPCFGVS